MDKSQEILSSLHLLKEEKKKQDDFKIKALTEFKLTFKAMYSQYQHQLFNAGVERVDYTDMQKLDVVISGLGLKHDGYISFFLEAVEDQESQELYRIKAKCTLKRVTYDLGSLGSAESETGALVLRDSHGDIRANLHQEQSTSQFFPWFVESLGEILQVS